MEGFSQVPGTSVRRIEAREVAKYLLFAARDQRGPVLHGLRIPGERLFELAGHAVLRAVFIAHVELNFHAHAITHRCTGRLSDVTVQV